jgi:hypothetical protein
MYSNEQLNAIHFSKIDFTFEFFSNENVKETKKSLTNSLNKKIHLKDKNHSDFLQSDNAFKMIPNYLGVPGMIGLSTGTLSFVEAKLILPKTLKWIRENGSTTDKCSLLVRVSFDGKKLGAITNMSKLDIGKFVLNFDEDKVYDAFPERKNTIYAKSIKFILPFNGIGQSSPEKTMWSNYMFVGNNYYGIDFTGIGKGHLDFKYLGGSNYERKYTTILSMIEHFIISTYEVLNNPTYSKEDIKKLNAVLSKHKNVVQAYKNYEVFKKQFPDISLMVDLKSHNQIVSIYYPKIRERIFDLLTKSGMISGLINYDSDSGKIQIKDTTLLQCFDISEVDIFECKIRGNINKCDIFHSEIIDSSVFESNVFGMSECKDSKIEDSYISKNVEVDNCYVFGTKGVFSGDMKGGIFRQGRATKFATFSDDTEVIEIEKINM